MELSVNSLLQGGKYRIVHYISSGGFGCTYEAEHVLLGKRVAIKEFFVKDFCNRDEHTCQVTVGTESKKGLVEKLRRKFIDEARALSALHHPGIVSVSDVFEENGTAYYVMDYIDGCSLSDLVRREGPLSETRALGYIRQVCAALSYVHTHDRLHLDIKPGNIMIDQDGNVILIDFGASKQYDECGGENTSTLMGRTPGYAPLEQLGNDVVKFLPATDIYAVGATLYKLLTGITPLSATRLASGESLPPLPAQVSASTRKAVASAMCLNKMQRPQSVEAFVQLLDEPEKRNSNDVAEDEATVFDVSMLVKKQNYNSINETTRKKTANNYSWNICRKYNWIKGVVVVAFQFLFAFVMWIVAMTTQNISGPGLLGYYVFFMLDNMGCFLLLVNIIFPLLLSVYLWNRRWVLKKKWNFIKWCMFILCICNSLLIPFWNPCLLAAFFILSCFLLVPLMILFCVK